MTVFVRRRRPHASEDGEHCPKCGSLLKTYPRSIHTEVARSLIALYQAVPHGELGHLPTIYPEQHGELAKCRYWGLAVGTGGHDGMWRLTDHGRDFVEGYVTVRRTAYIYQKRLIRFGGPHVDIRDCLGNRFSYEELMGMGVNGHGK